MALQLDLKICFTSSELKICLKTVKISEETSKIYSVTVSYKSFLLQCLFFKLGAVASGFSTFCAACLNVS